MKRIMSLLIVLLTLLSTFPTVSTAYTYNESHSMQNILESARMKTVAVTIGTVERYAWATYYRPTWTATGTMIGNGLILTNAHVVDTEHNDITIRTYTGESYTGTLLRVDNEKDLALLSFDSDAEGFTFADDLYKGMPVMTVGQPTGLPQWSFSEGTVQSLDYEYTCQGKAYSGYMSDNQVIGGNSGGPLLDSDGELVGIIRAKTEHDYALSIPMVDIKEFLSEE